MSEICFNEKSIKYADLIVPMVGCPLGETASDCPFIKFWSCYTFEERIGLLERLTEKDLTSLRLHHRKCVRHRRNVLPIDSKQSDLDALI
jgi:hypothetical protein